MKYEMIFGDYKFASCTCEIAVRSCYGDILEMSLIDPILIPDGWSVIAMRRIIKEPNRWTWEDKKARRLPEVGVSVVGITSHNEKLVVYVDDDAVVVKHKQDQDIVVVFNHSSFLTAHNPIETPAEKAQREEDVFVESLKSVEIHDGTVSSFFNQGARAAYRKLKGGE